MVNIKNITCRDGRVLTLTQVCGDQGVQHNLISYRNPIGKKCTRGFNYSKRELANNIGPRSIQGDIVEYVRALAADMWDPGRMQDRRRSVVPYIVVIGNKMCVSPLVD